jgi:signal transduction histidine kinase
LEKEDNSILITVADSGIGMSKELQQKLFGEFVRDPSIKREIRGTGLGLYIAKYIVEAHQGKIWAESEGENKGSKFYVKLTLN